MIKKDIGTGAGDIWQLLISHGCLSLRQIGERIHRKDSFILLAIGWLYKEDKIKIVDREGILFFEANQVLSQNYY